MYDRTVTSGFLIEKTFARMYREFLAGLKHFRPDILDKASYSWPRADVSAEEMGRQYRGLQREPIQAWDVRLHGSGVVEPTEQELAASLFLADLEEAGRAGDDFVFALGDAIELVRKITPPREREIIWARRIDAAGESPPGTMLMGYEPNTFYPPTCASPIADWMFFNSWPDPDEDGSQFRAYHEKLNKWGLFDSVIDAEEYLEAYLSFLPEDWDEREYIYYITEVREVTCDLPPGLCTSCE